MRKLSLFLFIVSFLICTSLAKVTSVSADVTFGSDDVPVVSDDMLDVYRHLALLGSVGDLVSSGASSISVSGTNDVNDLLDSILDNLASGLADDNPVSNFGLGVWETLDEFNTYLNNKAYDLMSDFDWYWDSGISDVVDFLGGVSSTKVPYKPNIDALKQFKALSHISEDSSPSPDPDFSFINNVNYLFLTSGSNTYDFFSFSSAVNKPFGYTSGFNPSSVTWFCSSSIPTAHTSGVSNFSVFSLSPIITINLNRSGDQYLATYTPNAKKVMFGEGYGFYKFDISSNKLRWDNLGNSAYSFQTSFAGLSTAINYIYSHFANINLYVDGEPWVVLDAPTVIDLSIDGLLKIFDSDKPVAYYYPSGTQIDYEALYNVILRAILNGTPVSQTTINEGNVYYDSHDSVYSPTIYNYYSTSEDEQDFIDDILNLATIPSFDTALVEPLAEPMTNGAAIFGAGLSVIPQDILIVVGAGFVLVLFGALINRLIE